MKIAHSFYVPLLVSLSFGQGMVKERLQVDAGVRVEAGILVGEAMAPLARALEGRARFVHVPDAAAALAEATRLLAPGDAVLVKGSNGVGLSRVVAALAGGVD